MGKKHKKHKPEWRTVDDYVDKPLEKPLKLVLKVGGNEVTELSGSGHDSSYYDERSDHERERHKEKKKKKKKKSEKEKDKHLDDDERRRRKEEKKKKREREQCESEAAVPVEPFTLPKNVERMSAHHDSSSWNIFCASYRGMTLPWRCLKRSSRDRAPSSTVWKDPHGFFAWPVTDAIAPGYSMIIKHPMDFSTMKDKITTNEYKTVTEFKTVYYKAAKKLLHTGFKMMSKERLFALKRSMSFMQDMDFSQQAAILGDEDVASEEPPPEVIPVPVESAKKSKKQPVMKEVISSYLYEPEGNACSLTDSTAEEHVLALVEHAADEARDRINRYMPNSKIGYLRKETEGSLVYTVVNQQDPDAEVTFLNSAYNTQTLQNNTVYPDLLPEEMDVLYSAYGDETGVQCALSLQEFVKGCGTFTKKLVDGLLDKMTGGDHSKAVFQIRQKRNMTLKPDEMKSSLCDMQVGDGSGMSGESSSVLDFMSMKSYSDMSLDMSLLNNLGSPSHLGVGDQSDMVHDPYEFLQSPEPGSTANS
ncbi:hypothetical protein JZ751_028267 [Albula glossodonta]|uniref:Bromodomain-containing protein 9 n=1 Tax=Albula glossodonta TaxID=121402 RepID=A0A8T2NBT8_9TELE|nr:hypothetical protein JZ751_028267 [Albula glossodonta]